MTRLMTSTLVLGVHLAGAAPAQDLQLLSPSITFTAREVFFRDPVTYVGRDGRAHTARSSLKLLLRGENFYDGATGPRYFLGRVLADAHYTSPDGRWVAVYFYDLRDVPGRAPIRIETTGGRFVTLRQGFDVGQVRWLTPEIRRRHGLTAPRLGRASAPNG